MASYGHATKDCNALQAEANRLKTNRDGNKSSGGKTILDKSKSKTWSKKADDAKKAAKDDLAAFIQKTVADSIKSSLKRKSDDEESDDDLAAFDLKEFDYEAMDNLKIDEDDDEASC